MHQTAAIHTFNITTKNVLSVLATSEPVTSQHVTPYILDIEESRNREMNRLQNLLETSAKGRQTKQETI